MIKKIIIVYFIIGFLGMMIYAIVNYFVSPAKYYPEIEMDDTIIPGRF